MSLEINVTRNNSCSKKYLVGVDVVGKNVVGIYVN